jgi:molybdopterin converting factor small subunit
MVVIVRFVGSFRSITRKTKLAIKLEGSLTLREVIWNMVKEKPALRRVLIDPELEKPRSNALILVNGREISVLNGLGTMLKEGDEVVFVPVLHGG